MKILKNNFSPLLKSLLNDSSFPEKIRSSTPVELLNWINEAGLEDAGEIIAFATSKQIEMIFDVDLWRSSSKGGDDLFDSDRFGTWVEILCEIGFQKAAEKIVEMDEDFLTMSFSSLVWVAETDWLADSCENDSRLEKLMDSRLIFELDRFTLFSRNEHSWDVFISLLVEMDSRYHDFLHRILERCSLFLTQESNSEGLYNILSADEQLVEDVAYEREKRRETQGYVAPANARAFLKLCEMGLEQPDYVTPKHLLNRKATQTNNFEKGDKLELITSDSKGYPNVRNIFLIHKGSEEFFLEQINYLANVLMSGWDWPAEIKRPGRALEIVLEVCEKSLEMNEQTFESFPRTFRLGFTYWLKKARK